MLENREHSGQKPRYRALDRCRTEISRKSDAVLVGVVRWIAADRLAGGIFDAPLQYFISRNPLHSAEQKHKKQSGSDKAGGLKRN
jgi:hypothetical protein